jgi:hypothetical protein
VPHLDDIQVQSTTGQREAGVHSPWTISNRDVIEPTRGLGIDEGVQEPERGKALLEPGIVQETHKACS